MITLNDWWLKQMADEKINARLQDAEAWRMAQAASKTKQQLSYQRFLVKLGQSLSRAGDYLQAHFGTGLQVDANSFSNANSWEEVMAHSAGSQRR